jgi:hypothetical protein
MLGFLIDTVAGIIPPKVLAVLLATLLVVGVLLWLWLQ